MSASQATIFFSALLFATGGSHFSANSAGAKSNLPNTMDVCPDNLNGLPDSTRSLTCGGGSDQTGDSNTILGDNLYAMMIGAQAAGVCRAAVHAGAIDLADGRALNRRVDVKTLSD